MAERLKKTGLFGGSFDPVHLAHTALAVAAYRHLGLDELVMIPAANPWQRPPLTASPAHRLEMLRLASQPYPWLSISTTEIERGGRSYTIDTLRTLPDNRDYYWILGSDQLANFCSWHAWQEITTLVHLAVAQRPGSNGLLPEPLRDQLERLGRPLTRIPFAAMPISATEIRQRLADNQDVASMLAPQVLRYIRRHRLYTSALQ